MKTNKKVDTSLPDIGGLYTRSENEGWIVWSRFLDRPDKLFVKAFPKVKDQRWENWSSFLETSEGEQFDFTKCSTPPLLLVDIQQGLYHGKPIAGASPGFMRSPGIWMKFVWEETFLWAWFRQQETVYGKPYYDWKRTLHRIDNA
jgi:hypothetical protein